MARRTVAQAAATRRELLAAALAVFGEGGYSAATLEQIASRAGVTRGALYHHFAGKTDLYHALLREEADQIMRPLLTDLVAGGPPLERLRRFLVAYGAALEHDARFRAALALLLFERADVPERARALTRLGYQAWLGAFTAVLEEAHARGELRAGVSPRPAAQAVVALAAGLTTTTLQAPGPISPVDAAQSLVEMLLRGIAA